jgi:diguanylate cyclase (GGDEF)-like protein
MKEDSRPAEVGFSDYYQESVKQFLALGLTQSQIEALKEYGLLAADNVTGFHEGRSGPGRLATLRRAIGHTAQSGAVCYYVEMDVRNLGGLNEALGHTGANVVYREIAGVIRSELSAVASVAVFFRHGGDEMSAVLIGTTEQAVRSAFERVQQGVAAVALRHKVHDVPHPKHPHDERFQGTGVRYGLARLAPWQEDDPTQVFRLADADMERNETCAFR